MNITILFYAFLFFKDLIRHYYVINFCFHLILDCELSLLPGSSNERTSHDISEITNESNTGALDQPANFIKSSESTYNNPHNRNFPFSYSNNQVNIS